MGSVGEGFTAVLTMCMPVGLFRGALAALDYSLLFAARCTLKIQQHSVECYISLRFKLIVVLDIVSSLSNGKSRFVEFDAPVVDPESRSERIILSDGKAIQITTSFLGGSSSHWTCHCNCIVAGFGMTRRKQSTGCYK